MRTFSDKGVGETIVLSVDFKTLLPAGVTIASCSVASTTGLVLVGSAQKTGSIVSQRVSGGTAARSYILTFTATLSDGEIVVEEVSITVVAIVST